MNTIVSHWYSDLLAVMETKGLRSLSRFDTVCEHMEDEIKKGMDEVYLVGFKNGQIEMRNKILKSINRDWSLIIHADLMIKLMKKINRMKLSKDITEDIYS